VAVREQTIAYNIDILIPTVKGFIEPGAHVIKLFTAVNYAFS
jgi:hypothetical protein